MIDIGRCRKFALVGGLAGLALTGIGLFVAPVQFFRSYLWAFLFWLGIALGCLPLLMLYHLTGGAWGFTIRRIAESATRTLPILLLLFVPIVFGIPHLYEWSHAASVAESEALRQKQPYLNVSFWLIRALVYFGAWLFYSHRLNQLSAMQDDKADITLANRFQRLSAPGLVVYGFT